MQGTYSGSNIEEKVSEALHCCSGCMNIEQDQGTGPAIQWFDLYHAPHPIHFYTEWVYKNQNHLHWFLLMSFFCECQLILSNSDTSLPTLTLILHKIQSSAGLFPFNFSALPRYSWTESQSFQPLLRVYKTSSILYPSQNRSNTHGILSSETSYQWFSKLCVFQKYLVRLLKHRFRGPIPRVSDSVCLGWPRTFHF